MRLFSNKQTHPFHTTTICQGNAFINAFDHHMLQEHILIVAIKITNRSSNKGVIT